MNTSAASKSLYRSDPLLPADLHAAEALIGAIPYARLLGVRFGICEGRLTTILPFDQRLLGNPQPPTLHGGATAAFMEISAFSELCARTGMQWTGSGLPASGPKGTPKTISFSIDYLRPGKCLDAYAEARINRVGRRYASVHVECWQEDRARLIAQATGHFLMPASHD